MLDAEVVTIVEAAAPSTADGLPVLASEGIVLSAGEIDSILEELEIHSQPQFVAGVGCAVGVNLLRAHRPVHARISIGVAKGCLLAAGIDVLDELRSHQSESALLLAKSFCGHSTSVS